MQFNMVAPCYFGLEKAAAFDLRMVGAQDIAITDGRINFVGDAKVLAGANLWSRCTERIMIRLAQFDAADFDALFDGVFAIDWENYIPKNGKFPVKGSSLSSTLSSVPACQRIVKKAIVERMRKGHKVQFLPERGEEYRVRVSIRKDVAEVFLDTSGDGLHKRGYRRTAGVAPLKETLAAAMADFARVRADSMVQDPFCGSGTLIIEAALKAKNIAPGMLRSFAAEHYEFLPKGIFEQERRAAREKQREDAKFEGIGYDIAPEMVALATHNAKKAGVEKMCRFEAGDVADFKADANATVLANPPYGERLLDLKQAAAIVSAFGRSCAKNKPAQVHVVSGDAEFEAHFGRKADKRRKVYNGMLPCQVYMYK